MTKFRIPLFAKIAASLLLLGLVFAKVDFSALSSSLASSNLAVLTSAVVVGFASWFLNTWKWQLLLSTPGAHLRYRELLRLTFIGIFYNLVLPGQVGGEIVKGVSLSRMGVSKANAAVSVVADRVTGLLALFLLGLGGLALSPQLAVGQSALLPWVVALTLILMVASFVLVMGQGPALMLTVGRTLGLSLHRFDLVSKLSSLQQGRGPSSMLAPLALSLAVQGSVALVNLMICIALGVQISYLTLLWVVAVVSLVQSLPISIAGIGVREGAYVYLLHQAGVDIAQALAVSLTVFAIQVLLALVGGLLQLSGAFKKANAASNSTH